MEFENEFIHDMVLIDPKTCVYQFIFDKYDSSDTKVIQYYVMHGQGLCIKLNSYVAHMLYAWSFSHNKSVPIAIKQNKYYLYLNIYQFFFLG